MDDDFEAFIAPPKYPLLSASFTRLCEEDTGLVSLDKIYAHLSQAGSCDIYLLGFAADFGASNADSRTGAEKAPKLLRE